MQLMELDMKKLFIIFTLLVMVIFAAFAREAKNALLIANGAYSRNFGELSQPISEAEDLKAALMSIGFEVTLVKNADREQMRRAVKAFKEKTQNAGGIAFFHYGGHAVQINGVNYLIPLNAELEDEQDAAEYCLNVDTLMDSMKGDSNVVVLDSCRNNPFATSQHRGGGIRGLAAVRVKPKNSIIVYSASEGNTAQDGIFTPILTKHITEPNITFSDVLITIHDEVDKKTNGKQVPEEYRQLKKNIFLAGRSSTAKVLTGSIRIESECAGNVFIDDEKKGFIKEGGSILIEGLYTGFCAVEIKSDSNSFKEKVRVIGDKTEVVNIKTGSIKLTSEVSGTVSLNGKDYGLVIRSIPVVLSKLLEGNYHIEVRTESQTLKKEATVHIGEVTAVAVYKPEEPAVKPVSPKKDTYSDDGDFYAFGFYSSYNLGISPVYKQFEATTTSESSYSTRGEKPFFNQGFSVGFTWARFYFGSIIDLQLCTGYTFYHHSFGNDESIIHHEFDAFGLKIGFGSRHIKFHFGAQLYSHWEEVQYASIRGTENTTGTARFGIAPGCDLEFVISNYFSMYAAYNGRITLSDPIGIKHSCNIGLNINVLKVRI